MYGLVCRKEGKNLRVFICVMVAMVVVVGTAEVPIGTGFCWTAGSHCCEGETCKKSCEKFDYKMLKIHTMAFIAVFHRLFSI